MWREQRLDVAPVSHSCPRNCKWVADRQITTGMPGCLRASGYREGGEKRRSMSQETCHPDECSFGRGALKQFGAEDRFSLPEFSAGSRRAVCTPANALIALRRTQG